MKYAELSSLSDEQLVHKELELEHQLVGARFRLYTNQLEDSSTMKKLRRDVARIRTAERAREKSQGLPKNALRDRFGAGFTAGEASEGATGGSFLKGVVDKVGSED